MAFTSDTDPGPVTVHAAVVQRRHQDKAKGGGREDGEWAGESEGYAFVIVDGATGGIREPEQPRSEQPRTERPQSERSPSDRPEPERPRSERPRSESPDPERADPERIAPEHIAPEHIDPGDGTRTDPGTGREPSPDRDPAPRPPNRPGTGEEGRGADEEHPGLPPRDGPGRPLPELASTGPASLSWTGAAAGALLLGGAALMRYARRIRRTTD